MNKQEIRDGAEERIMSLRDILIVADDGRVDGIWVDMTTAAVIISAYDAATDRQKEMFKQLSIAGQLAYARRLGGWKKTSSKYCAVARQPFADIVTR
jgi:hypothetical protein